MEEYILYLLLSIIAVCLVAIVYFFSKMSRNDEPDITSVGQQSEKTDHPITVSLKLCTIPDDVVFDERNLPVRTSRSRKKKVNFGKDFNAYLVKGGTLYHKKSCKKLSGKKVTTKHIYECIADKNKRPCPICKPRTEVHEWYRAKFPDSIYVRATNRDIGMQQLSLFDNMDICESEADELISRREELTE